MTSSGQYVESRRPKRADARRNYDRLVTAARPLLLERGADASLEEVAQRAGVGIGTLYRHFPHRDALVAAVVADSYEVMAAEGERLLAEKPPFEALAAYLAIALQHSGMNGCMSAAVKAAAHDESSRLYEVWARFKELGDRMVAEGQRDGTIRGDVDFRDVVMMTMAVRWTSDRPGNEDAQRADRLFRLMIDGLRPPPST